MVTSINLSEGLNEQETVIRDSVYDELNRVSMITKSLYDQDDHKNMTMEIVSDQCEDKITEHAAGTTLKGTTAKAMLCKLKTIIIGTKTDRRSQRNRQKT